MYNNASISVIIPCYNEEHGVVEVLKGVPPYIDEIIVVNNNSTDNSAQAIKLISNNKIKIINERKKGYGRAYKTGFREASGDLIVALDADGSYSLDGLDKLINILIKEKVDFICGNRFLLMEKEAMGFVSYFGNKIINFIAFILFQKRISDINSGMWIFKRKMLDNLNLISNGMAFSIEIKVRVTNSKYLKFSEVPIGYKKRIGKSKVKVLQDALDIIFILLRLRISIKPSEIISA